MRLIIIVFAMLSLSTEAETIKFPQSIYTGEVINGRPDGQGKLVVTDGWAEGETFTGLWKNGLRAEGHQTYKNGSSYIGQFGSEYPSSYGRHGNGQLLQPDTQNFVGRFERNNPVEGVLTLADNTTLRVSYQWNWAKFTGGRNLDGVMTLANGTTFIGSFDNSYLPKEGTWKRPDQSFFAAKYDKKWHPDNEPALPENDNSPLKPAESGMKPASSGTGFFVTNEGHVVTNYHVVEHCESIEILWQGASTRLTILASDKINDLALLKADLPHTAPIPISTEDPQLLQSVFAAGFPFGNAISSTIKITKGVVSSLTGVADNYSNIQIDAALQPGNSGGPILDNNGNLIAVAVAKLDLATIVQAYGVVPENTNFGIKASVVRSLLAANNLDFSPTEKTDISTSELSRRITASTIHLTCLMTDRQAASVRAKKRLFSDSAIEN